VGALDPDERIHPEAPYDWGRGAIPPSMYCDCRLCAPQCGKAPAYGNRYCMPCFQGYHNWAEAPCGSPFHYDILDPCECLAGRVD
jgi:hypothetical protein